MTSFPDTVAIIGAGAMGCLFAARMAEAGAQVTLVDVDKARIDAIARDGIRLTDDRGTRDIRVGAALAGAIPEAPQLVLLFTKSYHSAAAIASIRHWQAQGPLVMSLQNGIGNAEKLADVFGADRVLQGTVHIPADLSPPNGVATHGFGHIHFGGFTAKAHRAAPDVRDLLECAGFDAVLSDDVERVVWEKVAFNAALNATSMICRATNGQINTPAGRRIAQGVVQETVAVAQARGLSLDAQSIIGTVHAALVEHGHHKPSMLQDREHGRMTEIEAINGAIVREGERLGIATPVCATLADLVRVIEGVEHTSC